MNILLLLVGLALIQIPIGMAYADITEFNTSVNVTTSSQTNTDPTQIPDGYFILPMGGQENGDGVWAGQHLAFYENEIANAEISYKYGQGNYPLENYQAIGFFTMADGSRGDDIRVSIDLINPQDTFTLIYTNTQQGEVSNFSYQLLGGDLVLPEPTPQPSKMTVCHNGKELSVPDKAVRAHVAHGDAVGNCPNELPEITDPKPTPTPTPQPEGYVISTVLNSGIPGCEETAQGCYTPKTLTMPLGETLTFANPDSSAHTFTSGTSSDGPSGIFDYGLVMSRGEVQWVADQTGEIPYFCMVHPYMTGMIIVVDDGSSPQPIPVPQPTPNPTTNWEQKYNDIVSKLTITADKLGDAEKKLDQAQTTLAEQIQQNQTLKDKIENLNALVMEQVKVIYKWVLNN